MTDSTRRAHQREHLRREILDAASAEFASAGYEQLSMRKLAAQLGCAPGTLYLYFRDKDELLRAVVDESFAELLRTLKAIPSEGDPLTCLKAKMRAYIDFGLSNPNHYKCAFVLPSVRPAPYSPHPAFAELVSAVSAYAQQGFIGEGDVELASQVLWSCIHGLTSLLIARPNFPWVEKEKLIDELIETAIAGVARAPSCGRTGAQSGNQRRTNQRSHHGKSRANRRK
jgi:AcrR family transcriptional regulator